MRKGICGVAALPLPLGEVPQCAHWGGEGLFLNMPVYILAHLVKTNIDVCIGISNHLQTQILQIYTPGSIVSFAFGIIVL